MLNKLTTYVPITLLTVGVEKLPKYIAEKYNVSQRVISKIKLGIY